MKLKEKLVGSLGVLGYCIWFVVSVIFSFAPLMVLDLPMVVDFIAIFVIQYIPLFGEIVRCALYVWAFIVVLSGPINVISIIFFVCFAIYVIAYGIPLVAMIISMLTRPNDI